jgi:hypothetical protein
MREIFPLEKNKEAFQLAETGHPRGKVALEIQRGYVTDQ